MNRYFAGMVVIYFHPLFYKALKLVIPHDFDEVSDDGQITTELATNSPGQAVGISTQKISGSSWAVESKSRVNVWWL